ncbi:hypothetical protein Q7689_32480 [Nocardiopsis tropica]|nr:hypothetical protein [Nocardiopsis tropica]
MPHESFSAEQSARSPDELSVADPNAASGPSPALTAGSGAGARRNPGPPATAVGGPGELRVRA